MLVNVVVIRDKSTNLDEVFAFSFSDERLKLRGREGIYQSSLRYDEEKHLSAGEYRELISLQTRSEHTNV